APYFYVVLPAAALGAAPWLRIPRRFGLRALLIATTVVGFTLGFVGWGSRHSDAPPRPASAAEIEAALGQVRIGMPYKEAIAIMHPVSIDLGTVYLGGNGAIVLYFQVNDSQQVWLRIGNYP